MEVVFVCCVLHLRFAFGDRVAVYCSDVSGAFDKVSALRLVRKLRRWMVHPRFLKVMESLAAYSKVFGIYSRMTTESILVVNQWQGVPGKYSLADVCNMFGQFIAAIY